MNPNQNNPNDIFIVDSLTNYLLAIDTLINHCGYYKYNIFRGVKNKDYNLVPKIYRTYGNHDSGNYIYNIFNENDILNQFKKLSFPLLKNKPSNDDYLQWLILAQHYNLPTKLLDFTSNPLVALYFAVEDIKFEKDCAVWLLNSYLFDEFKKIKIIPPPEIEHNPIIAGTKKLLPEILIPYYYDDRMENQSSRFLMFGTDITPLDKQKDVDVFILQEHHVTEYKIEKAHKVYNPGDNHFLAQIVINGLSKCSILDQLDLIGINEMFIYRSLDNVGKYIDEKLAGKKFSESAKNYVEYIESQKSEQDDINN